MGLQHTNIVDSTAMRDGWAVLTIHHFDTWEPAEEKLQWLHKKFQHYLKHLQQPAWLNRFADAPTRIELVGSEPATEDIAQLCRILDIHLITPEP